MKEIYVFEYAFGKAVIGDQVVSENETGALEERDNFLNHLTEKERGDLLYCRIYMAEVTPEQVEEMKNEGISSELEEKIWRRDIYNIGRSLKK